MKNTNRITGPSDLELQAQNKAAHLARIAETKKRLAMSPEERERYDEEQGYAKQRETMLARDQGFADRQRGRTSTIDPGDGGAMAEELQKLARRVAGVEKKMHAVDALVTELGALKATLVEQLELLNGNPPAGDKKKNDDKKA